MPSHFLDLSNTSHAKISQGPEARYLFAYRAMSLELDPKLFEGKGPFSSIFVSGSYLAQYQALRYFESKE